MNTIMPSLQCFLILFHRRQIQFNVNIKLIGLRKARRPRSPRNEQKWSGIKKSQQPFLRLPSSSHNFYTLIVETRGWSQIQGEKNIFPELTYSFENRLIRSRNLLHMSHEQKRFVMQESHNNHF